MPAVDLQTGLKGNNKSIPVKTSSTSSSNGFMDWLNDLGNQFMGMHTNNVNNSGFATNMRGNYNYQEMANGNIGPLTESLTEAVGPLSGQYETPTVDIPTTDDSNSDNASLDPTGYDQANWQYEKYLELLAEQRAYNSAEAEKTRQWQERMSNTAYQRAVEDLEKAGLNKWLAITGGNGSSASTPSGATASSSLGSASVPNPEIYKVLMQFISKIITSAMSIVDIF